VGATRSWVNLHNNKVFALLGKRPYSYRLQHQAAQNAPSVTPGRVVHKAFSPVGRQSVGPESDGRGRGRQIVLPMQNADIETRVRLANVDQRDAAKFLSRISWSVIGVLGTMAAALWVAPLARAAGNRPLARLMGLAFVLAFFALIALVAILRRGLARQVARGGGQQDLLAEQNAQLTRANEELTHQADALQEQAVELETQAQELADHVDELERSNAALLQSERLQHTLADETMLLNRRLTEAQHVSRLGYWEIDSQTGSVYWSDEMYRLCGMEPTTGQPPTSAFLKLVHPEDQQRMRDVADAAVRESTEFTEQYRIVDPGGALRYIQSTGRVVTDHKGEKKLVGTIQDVTDRMQLEARLRQSQKMQAVGQLAGGVAHDFNNVLTVIEGYSGLLIAGAAEGTEEKEHLIEIREAARRAAALTRQLLAFSRQQVLQPRVIDLNNTVEEVERMLRRLVGEDIDFHTHLATGLAQVKADPGQVEQVLMNLVVNARDAMPSGGRLTVETANVVLDATYAQRYPVKTPGPHVMLAVTDSGMGIPPEHMERIFEPFFTTKASGKGTGLGLATVHGIVEQSGGHIWVYSEPGRGTTFKVYLPATKEGATPMTAAYSDPAPRRGTERILLVEDEAPLRAMASKVLRRAGYTVVEASDGRDALEICRRDDIPLDLIVSDMVMPVMGGRELAASAQLCRPGVPVVLMSGYTRDSMADIGDLTTGGAFLEKPFTTESLTHKVREVLDRTPVVA
jgi:PAS domain S-box-containing protein